MRKIFLTIVVLGIVVNSFCQSGKIDKMLVSHFEKYPAELYRYSGLTSYGESKNSIDQKQIDAELELYRKIKSSDILDNPTSPVFALCHNIIIHSPETGKEFLTLLNRPTTNQAVIGSLFLEAIFTGEFGEQLALENLKSSDTTWSKTWAFYLSKNAVYDSSIPVIHAHISNSTNAVVQMHLINSLMYISGTKSNDFLKSFIDTTNNDYLQSTAIFVYAELTGYEGIAYLETVETVGEKSAEEKKSSIDWLKAETSPQNKFGNEVVNDLDFINRFGDIQSPAMIWLEKEGFLSDKIAENPIAMSREKKDELLDLLIESKGFGLEAVKASLFLSIVPTDIDRLLLLRQLNVYSPNRFTQSRAKTIGIFIRYLKRQ